MSSVSSEDFLNNYRGEKLVTYVSSVVISVFSLKIIKLKDPKSWLP